MTKRMLIDATHAEETRVAVVDGQKLVDFDYESKVRKQLKGSIFLAKVTRVEPSLQAAFVNFGGNRHGFLPFSEIHPDYFRIPIADREALLAEQADEMKLLEAEEEAEEAAQAAAQEAAQSQSPDAVSTESAVAESEAPGTDEEDDEEDEVEEVGGEDVVAPLDDETTSMPAEIKPQELLGPIEEPSAGAEESAEDTNSIAGVPAAESTFESAEQGAEANPDAGVGETGTQPQNSDEGFGGERHRGGRRGRRGRGRGRGRGRDRHHGGDHGRRVETVGGDGLEGDHPIRPTMRRHYKIQEVIKRGQIMLVQVSKEERGNKGAAVTTYLSLPGRYCVLMPNSTRAGGVSRKIANYQERQRMREILAELKVPDGMSVIMRTAGMSRTKPEIKRDLDYLTKLWDNIRELTLQSTAPALIHEEGNLIRRSIRDIYGRDVEDIYVAGDEGFKLARDFMKMMMPSHVKRVNQYKDARIPLFNKFGVENQIFAMGEPVVTLRSGGYLVINPTEALVSIDVNSGRATRERHIEETALKTNLEAAEELARQLRLRDLGGLVVVDFIDMEDRRNNRRVEERLKQALSSDRARIQIGRISSFGLLELSRQRLNPSLTEAQFEKCSHCRGIGHVRTVDSAAITALRALEEEGIKGRSQEVILRVSNQVALYMLNNKRNMLADIEQRYGFSILIRVDDDLPSSGFAIEQGKQLGAPQPQRPAAAALPSYADEETVEEGVEATDGGEAAEIEDEGAQPGPNAYQERSFDDRGGYREGGQGRRRRRGRRGGRRHNPNYQGPHDHGGQPYDAPPGDASQNQFGGGEAVDEEEDNRGNRIDYNEQAPDRDGNNWNQGGGRHRDDRGGGGRHRRGGRGRGRGGRDRGHGGGGRGNWNDRGDSHQGGQDRPVAQPSHEQPAYDPAPQRAEPVENRQPAPAAESPSNDVNTPPSPPRVKDYEKVNEPSGEKKKGWWRK